MKHANVSIFIPHAGCPQQCSFCNQRSITGQTQLMTPQQVKDTLERAAEHLKEKSHFAEIAFFGGSFTAIERSYMLSLLEAAAPFVRDKMFTGIRISTRPDAIDDEVLMILRQYGVTVIELGAQSMDDRVLRQNRRGHTAEQVRNASKQIKKAGFSLGLQMMTGLWGDSVSGALQTAQEIAQLDPDCVRIYPAIIMRDTELAERYLSGEYIPMTLEQSVELCGTLLEFFEERSIPVIRLGLHSTPELLRDRLAGPWHPAFRELCESRLFLRRLQNAFTSQRILSGSFEIYVAPSWVSRAVGQKKCNVAELSALGYNIQIKSDPSVEPADFVLRSQTQPESR